MGFPLLQSGVVVALGHQSSDFVRPPEAFHGQRYALALANGLPGDPVVGAEPMLRVYYGRALTEADTYQTYVADGGIVLQQAIGGHHDAAYWLEAFRDIGRDSLPPVVLVGPYQAVAVHADPMVSNDIRPWAINWSDGMHDFELIGLATPEELIGFARSLYC